MRVKDPRLIATIRCQHCGAQRLTPMEQYMVGDVLQPYPGGGTYGRCLRCKKTGMEVIAVPKEEVIPPVGWREIPNE